MMYFKYLTICLLFLLLSCMGSNTRKSRPETATQQMQTPTKSVFDYTLKSLDGTESISLSKYKGKKILFVNVASKCGYTVQYAELQKLHEAYSEKLVILGFPANNFGKQEPGTNQEIATFCKLNYGVSFQMFEKISVKGEDQHPLYQWLSKKEFNGWNDQAPQWNFNKYLVDERGNLLKYFGSGVKPFDDELIQIIES